MTSRSPSLGSVIVIAKRPAPGRVKTRLTPPLTPQEAADVAAAALNDTLRAASAVPADDHVLAFTDAADGWLPEGWRTVLQPAGGLDLRLSAAFDAVGSRPSVLVGMDTPQFRPEQLEIFDPARYDACLGMAEDGGFWTIGFADPRIARSVITGVPMSTEHTGADQLARLRAAGLTVQLLDVLVDVDTIGTALQVAAVAPSTEFANALTQSATAA